MSRLIGAMEISQYAQRYNMPFEEDTPLTMAWCFDMVDAAERKGREDAIEEYFNLIEDRILERGRGLYLIEAEDFKEQLREKKK